MHIHNKSKKLIKVGLYAAVITCAAGAATGTYAWYSYQKDVDVDFVGTTIKADKEIQVGLRCDSRITALEQEYPLGEISYEENVKMNASDSETYVIYWVRGNYLSEILKSFQNAIGSATGKLNAITAGYYRAGWAEDIGNDTDTLAQNTWNGFKETPTTKPSDWKYMSLVNSKKNYFYMPLVFRALSNEKQANGDPKYLEDVEIYLADFATEDLSAAANGADLAQAVRCKVDYPANADTSKNYIFDPNAMNDENLPVGGVLNLNLDRFYDSYRGNGGNYYEIPYGEWETDPIVYTADPIDTDQGIHADQCTTFEANHQVGVYPIDMTQSAPRTCETKSRFAAVDNAYTEGKGIAKTNAYKNYAYVDLSIYLEGWDTNIVNNSKGTDDYKSTVDHTFSVDLEFSIN